MPYQVTGSAIPARLAGTNATDITGARVSVACARQAAAGRAGSGAGLAVEPHSTDAGAVVATQPVVTARAVTAGALET